MRCGELIKWVGTSLVSPPMATTVTDNHIHLKEELFMLISLIITKPFITNISYRWLSARLQYLHCWRTRDTTVSHATINIVWHLQRQNISDLKLTTETPYLTLRGEQWVDFPEYLGGIYHVMIELYNRRRLHCSEITACSLCGLIPIFCSFISQFLSGSYFQFQMPVNR